MRDAIVICTYGRHEALRQTLHSVASQSVSGALLLVVVEKDAGEDLDEKAYPFALDHVHYTGLGSASRQRNAGLDRLPPSVERVFFLDDDVTLAPGYLETLGAVLDERPDVGGAGGVLTNDPPSAPTLPERFFLLGGKTPGRVLPSGHTVAIQVASLAARTPTHWLNTGSSVYRRALLEEHRFDPAIPGAVLEDLDHSYRIGQEALLVVEPRARLYHHASPHSRPGLRARVAMETIQRYRFVEKNLRHPLCKAAFWWSVTGQALARLTSRHPDAPASLGGLVQGARAILRPGAPRLDGA